MKKIRGKIDMINLDCLPGKTVYQKSSRKWFGHVSEGVSRED